MASTDGTHVLVPLHPEPVDGHPTAMRWVVSPGLLPFVGAVERVPDVLRALLDDGTLAPLEVEPTAVLTRLRPGRTWRREGARVRTALQGALALPEQWSPTVAVSPDDVLRAVVHEVIDGEVGAYVRSHGGRIELLDVRDGHVRVRLNGACTHCPAARLTLGERFETAVRARYPGLRSVSSGEDASTPAAGGSRRLPTLQLRRFERSQR